MSPPSAAHADVSPRALEEASEWFACLSDAAADAGALQSARDRWRTWLDAHPDNIRAWQRVEAITRRLAPLTVGGATARRALESRPPARRRALKALGLFALAGSGIFAASRLPWREWEHTYAMAGAAYRTDVGQLRALTLPESGRVWLGASSVLDIEYSASLRRLRLYSGDLLVDTAHDNRVPPRAFVVDTPHGRLRALGTRFAVRVSAGSTRVDVFEGAVEIAPADGGASRVTNAGEHASFDRASILDQGPSAPGRESWSRGLLVAQNMPLAELLDELGRWHARRFSCDPAVAELRVVGAFPLGDPERVLAALEESLPVQWARTPEGAHLTARKTAAGSSGKLTPPRVVR